MGEIGLGGRIGSQSTDSEGGSWSLLINERDIELQVDDTSILLQGYGSSQPVQYVWRHDNPPELTFTSEGRPDVWWYGYELRIGEEHHSLRRSGHYAVSLDGSLLRE
jgi:hypothetical protein